MNQMPISECYLSKFNIQPHYHRLIVYIHKVRWVFQLRRVFQTQVPISLVILVIGIQDLYTSKYKYTIKGGNMGEVEVMGRLAIGCPRGAEGGCAPPTRSAGS